MKWSKVDADKVFKWRRRVSKTSLPLILIYCAIMMMVVMFTPVGDNMGSISGFTILAIILLPVITIAITSALAEKILHRIGYKACEVQVEIEVLETMWSETLQRIALNEQVADGGYPDDEYLEQFEF